MSRTRRRGSVINTYEGILPTYRARHINARMMRDGKALRTHDPEWYGEDKRHGDDVRRMAADSQVAEVMP